MSDPAFTERRRVYHRQLRRFGTFVMHDDLDRATSHVEFDDDPDGLDSRRITTAQLVPAEEADMVVLGEIIELGKARWGR